MRPSSLAVIGLGAIGGSLAWQARLAGVPRVVGYSPSRADGVQALRASAITELADTPARARAGRGAGRAGGSRRRSRWILSADCGPALEPGALLTDVCSVKGPVLSRAVAEGLGDRFAGGHPLAGTHASGFAAARPDRLRGCVVYVCETGQAGGDRAARRVMRFWEDVLEAAAGAHRRGGARPAARLDQPSAPGGGVRAGQDAGRSRAGRGVVRHRARGTPPGSPPAVPRCGSTSCSSIAPPWPRRWEPPRAELAELRQLLAAGDADGLRALPHRRAAVPARDSTDDRRRDRPGARRQEHHPPRAAARRHGPGDEPRRPERSPRSTPEARPACSASSAPRSRRSGRAASCRSRAAAGSAGPTTCSTAATPARRPASCSASWPASASRRRSPATARSAAGRCAGSRAARAHGRPLHRARRRRASAHHPGRRAGCRSATRCRSRAPRSRARSCSPGVAGGVEVELREPHGRSRDHTERMLRAFGYAVEERDGWIRFAPTGRHRAVRARRFRATRPRRRFSSAPRCWPKAASSGSPAWASIRRGPASLAVLERMGATVEVEERGRPVRRAGGRSGRAARRRLRATEVGAGRDSRA